MVNSVAFASVLEDPVKLSVGRLRTNEQKALLHKADTVVKLHSSLPQEGMVVTILDGFKFIEYKAISHY